MKKKKILESNTVLNAIVGPVWVSVKKQLPKDGDTVLVWQNNLSDKKCSRWQKAYYSDGIFEVYPKVYGKGYFEKTKFKGYDLEGDVIQITHWMTSPNNPI